MATDSARPAGHLGGLTSRLPTRDDLRALLPGSAGNLGTQGLLMVLGLGTGMLSARVLGPSGRGLLSVLVLVPTMLALAGTLGTEFATYYLWHRDDGSHRRALLGLAGLVSALSGGLLGAVGLVVIAVLEPRLGLTWQLAAAAAVPLGIANAPLTMMLLADGRLLRYNASRLAGPACYAGAVGVLWFTGRLGVASAFGSWLGAQAVTVAVDLGLVLGRSRLAGPRWNGATTRHAMRYGLRSHVGTVAQYGALRLDQVMLAGLAGNAVLGTYYSAVAMAEIVLQLASNAGTAMMAVLGSRPRHEQRRIAAVTVGVVSTGTLAGAIVLAILGGPIITLVVGPAYLPGLPALRLLLPGLVLLAAARILNYYFIAIGSAGVYAAAAVASLMPTLVGCALLIPAFGAAGAALASDAAYALMAAWLGVAFWADGRAARTGRLPHHRSGVGWQAGLASLYGDDPAGRLVRGRLPRGRHDRRRDGGTGLAAVLRTVPVAISIAVACLSVRLVEYHAEHRDVQLLEPLGGPAQLGLPSLARGGDHHGAVHDPGQDRRVGDREHRRAVGEH